MTVADRYRTAAELDELFETKVRPWRFHKTKTALQRGLEERNVVSAPQS